MSQPDWYEDAACRGMPISTFFPEKGARVDALKVCADCSVLLACGIQAVRQEEFGIWGGMPARRRMLIRAKLRDEGYYYATAPEEVVLEHVIASAL